MIDMERIDPDAVELPGWYRPNPGRARDLAFIFFTGEGERTRANRITNRRWALSAFGAASSAALSDADTVYSVTPSTTPPGLLTSVGGAIAGGARLAHGARLRPETFWDEVRRYGVTVVSYTWALLRELVEAPPHPGERHHPVRLFMGSGMPLGLWRRVHRALRPGRRARVLGVDRGRGDARQRLRPEDRRDGPAAARLGPGEDRRPRPRDGRSRRLRADSRRECDTNEVGVLVAEVDPDVNASLDTPLRGVFRPDDAWLATGDLFRKDPDGDFWLLDSISALIRTAHGPVPPTPIRDALWALPAVDLALCFGVRDPDAGGAVAVGAVTLRDGHEIDAADVSEALQALTAG